MLPKYQSEIDKQIGGKEGKKKKNWGRGIETWKERGRGKVYSKSNLSVIPSILNNMQGL